MLSDIAIVAVQVMGSLVVLIVLADWIVHRACEMLPRWVGMWRRMLDECREVSGNAADPGKSQ